MAYRPTYIHGGAFALALAIAVLVFGAAASGASGAAPDPRSDADGDGLPYEWEVAPVVTAPPSGKKPKCTSKQRLRKGKCVRKCKKSHKLKRGKCVKKKKKSAGRRKHPKARASIAPANVGSLGANPNHKDIFVQINYSTDSIRQSLSCSELDAITAAFASAPVGNPDGTTGVNLHIDAGVTCPSRSYNLGGSTALDVGACPNVGTAFSKTELPESRIGTFHIAGFVPTCGQTGAAGVADLHGAKILVFTDGPSFAHILMHELGHNLGLDHPYPGQPNRLSSMNTLLAVSDTGFGHTEVLDYQRISLPALDENNLSEEAGLSAPPEAHRFYIPHACPPKDPKEPLKVDRRNAWPGDGPIDWNCSSSGFPIDPPGIDPGTQAIDVNGDGVIGVLPATGPEWPTLDYGSGGKIGPR